MVSLENKITQIRKRDGRIVDFDQAKIAEAIWRALQITKEAKSKKQAEKLSDQLVMLLNKKFHSRSIPAVEEIQDLVEEALIRARLIKTAKAYILYREQHRKIREIKNMLDSNELVENYLKQLDWRVKENSNMSFSLQGLNNYISSAVSSRYWLNKVYPQEVRQAHLDGDFHIHDLQLLSAYCAGWDLGDLLLRGFGGVTGKIESKSAKHFRSALGQIVNFFYTLQGEVAGAQAFSNFDTYLAPFIRHDNLTYNEVKQSIQEFLFNVNVPTRVGFQCMSEDTEILSQDGWKKYDQIKTGDIIATFNIEKGFIEYLPVKNIFAKKYKGQMYNLKNRISDQLISPEHRVVRRRFGADGYVLEKIEKILELRSPFMVPVGSEGYISGDDNFNEDIVKLIAWVVAEGSLDRSGRGGGRISIYQSEKKNKEDYGEIVSLCNSLKLKYTERAQLGLGEECNVIRFDADSTRKILKYFDSDKKKGIKFIPKTIIDAGVETARLFLETYIKGDGHEGCKITTTSKIIRDGLLQVIVNTGYSATVLNRKPDNNLSKKDRYIIRIIKHKDTYINKVKKINYNGIIWCPNTKNETVIAKRKGKIFITGNTPFTNITMDLFPPENLKNEAVIIGGKPQPSKYGDYQKEMDMLNSAFAEVMMEGDAKGRVFTFPIPTYNITKNFDWDKPVVNKIFDMTAKYGIPYFSNFINSDMNPEDARSMCCRLRLDNRELRRRGGGLFAANPLTGSIGVVTLNLARIGYLAHKTYPLEKEKAQKEFFRRLEEVMNIARTSLEIKREILEKLTEEGLYPYAKHYLVSIKEKFGEYWRNHFSTIGINAMNEALLNLIGQDISTEEGRVFALKAMDFMRDKLMDFQNETNNLYNLEATPAEGATYRLAKLDKARYPEIVVANEDELRKNGAEPYYTNSTNLPVNFTDDIFSALKLQDDLQIKYTGGTVIHVFVGEKMPGAEATKNLVRKISENFKLPYYTITPTFSICPDHGYLAGEHFECPECHKATEVYSRIVGYLRPVQQWNKGKQAEFKDRKVFKVAVPVA